MRPRLRVLLPLAAALLAAVAPTASAATGGAAPEPSPEPTLERAAPDGGTAAPDAVATPVATASASGITLSARATTLRGRRVTVTGTAPATARALRIEQRGRNGRWTAVATATVAPDRAFAATWQPRVAGRLRLRAIPVSSASRASGTGPELEVTVLRPGVATWYGPGFWGRRTACGLRLRKVTVGVAHRTLPCGTQVQLLYRGRTLLAPVIDRGPFTRGRAWDLTRATRAALGIRAGVFTIGALPLTNVTALPTPFQAPPVRMSGRAR